MALSALMAAALCILAPLSIPIGPIPVTLSILVIGLLPYLLNIRQSLVAVLLYILIGSLGLPVFSGFEGGFQKLIGPTGGFILGYIPFVTIGGAFIICFKTRFMHLLGLFAGLFMCYLLGTLWLMLQLCIDLTSALSMAVIPFLPFDAVKLAAAVMLGSELKKRL